MGSQDVIRLASAASIDGGGDPRSIAPIASGRLGTHGPTASRKGVPSARPDPRGAPLPPSAVPAGSLGRTAGRAPMLPGRRHLAGGPSA